MHKYTFKRIGEPSKNSADCFGPVILPPSPVQQVDSGLVSLLGEQSLDVITPEDGQHPAVMELNIDVNIDPERADWPNHEQTQRLVRYREEENNYVCQICGSFTPDSDLIMSHILQDHGDTWRTFDPALMSVSEASDENTETAASIAAISGAPTAEIAASGSAPTSTPTIHLDPNWRTNLIKTFNEDAPTKWSETSRNAWRNNERITDPKTFKKVRQEIVESLIQHCLGVFGDIKRPSESLLQKLVEDLLAKQYPFMFSMEPGNAMDDRSLNHGRGLGGWSGEQNIFYSFNPFI